MTVQVEKLQPSLSTQNPDAINTASKDAKLEVGTLLQSLYTSRQKHTQWHTINHSVQFTPILFRGQRPGV